MSHEYRAKLLDAISSSIDDKVTKFKDELDASKRREIDVSGNEVDSRMATAAAKFESARLAYNKQVRAWNDICEKKKNSLYSPIDWESSNFDEAATGLSESLNGLDESFRQVQDAIDRRWREQAHLEELNDSVSRLEAKDAYKNYTEAVSRAKFAVTKLERLQHDYRELDSEIGHLVAKAQNVHVAAGEINDGLKAIFAESGRLELILDSDAKGSTYYLHNRGKPVSPSNLSVGERNIVALVYYFTSVRRALDELFREQSSEILVSVLDDPISSVDIDNRLGIHGFIESRLRTLLCHDYCAFRGILMSHDITVAREFNKGMLNALFKANEYRGENLSGTNVKKQIARFEIGMDHKLFGLPGDSLKKRNEYGVLFNAVWAIAEKNGDPNSTDLLNLGNNLRRVLEAFSTFIYNESTIPSAALSREYTRITGGRDLGVDLGPGHRLFLHGNSHTEDNITSLGYYGGFISLDPSEQIKHVRKTLAFLYILQPVHVASIIHSNDIEGVASKLKEWSLELLGHDIGGSNG